MVIFPAFFPNKHRKLCFVINVLNNETIILLNLAEFCLVLVSGNILHGNVCQTLYKQILVLVHVHCRDFNIFSSHALLPSDLVAQSVEWRRSNPKVVGSIPTLFRVFLCPCVGPFPSVGLTLTWFIWDRNRALHITLYSIFCMIWQDNC